MGVVTLNEDDFFIWMPVLIVFILAIHTIWVYGITSDAMLYTGVLLFLAFCGFLSWRYVKPRMEKKKQEKITHTSLLITRILSHLPKIKCGYSLFFICIAINKKHTTVNTFNEFQRSSEFKWTLQHLEAYPNIFTSWSNFNNLINEINDKLDDLKKYISTKMNDKLIDKENILPYASWVLIYKL